MHGTGAEVLPGVPGRPRAPAHARPAAGRGDLTPDPHRAMRRSAIGMAAFAPPRVSFSAAISPRRQTVAGVVLSLAITNPATEAESGD